MQEEYKGRPPVEATFGEKKVLLYTVSHLCWALMIKPITYKKWEEKGYVPRPLFLGKIYGVRKGNEIRKREGRVRYFLYEEIEAIADVYSECIGRKRVMKEEFQPEVAKRLRHIRASFKKEYLHGTGLSRKSQIEVQQ